MARNNAHLVCNFDAKYRPIVIERMHVMKGCSGTY